MMPVGLDNLVFASEEAQEQVQRNKGAQAINMGDKKWREGELEFEAAMRSMDNAVSL